MIIKRKVIIYGYIALLVLRQMIIMLVIHRLSCAAVVAGFYGFVVITAAAAVALIVSSLSNGCIISDFAHISVDGMKFAALPFYEILSRLRTASN